MLWIFIIIFIMNILCESHIDVYVYVYEDKIYKMTFSMLRSIFFLQRIYCEYLLLYVI